MGGACTVYGRGKGVYRDWGDPSVDRRIILRWILKKWEGVMDWTELAQDRDRWRAHVNAVMNLRVP
jgi:hypothetical protein